MKKFNEKFFIYLGIYVIIGLMVFAAMLILGDTYDKLHICEHEKKEVIEKEASNTIYYEIEVDMCLIELYECDDNLNTFTEMVVRYYQGY